MHADNDVRSNMTRFQCRVKCNWVDGDHVQASRQTNRPRLFFAFNLSAIQKGTNLRRIEILDSAVQQDFGHLAVDILDLGIRWQLERIIKGDFYSISTQIDTC